MQAGKKAMPLLTLARYINETALMSYRLVTYKESLIAAGCLRLAMKMSEPSAVWVSFLYLIPPPSQYHCAVRD